MFTCEARVLQLDRFGLVWKSGQFGHFVSDEIGSNYSQISYIPRQGQNVGFCYELMKGNVGSLFKWSLCETELDKIDGKELT